MDAHAVVVQPLVDEQAGDSPLLAYMLQVLTEEGLPQVDVGQSEQLSTWSCGENVHGVMFVAVTPALKLTEIGRLTDLDLFNPVEYRHQLLAPFRRTLTQAKKDGRVPTQTRALFLHHAEELPLSEYPQALVPMVRRVALWTRFWSNLAQRNKASAG